MNKKKNLLMECIERENAYLADQEVGSEEYKASLKRLMDLEKQMSESPKNDRVIRNVIEAVKVGGSIVLPIIGLVCITATEKEYTFTGALKDYTKLFLPKHH